jgi:hypothetical protein
MAQILHPSQKFELNIFKLIEAMRLKIIASRSPSMASRAYQFNENLPIGSKVIGDRQNRLTDDLIILLYFFIFGK